MNMGHTITDYFYHRTALITGASRGLGLHIARSLWNVGANLILVARSHDTLQMIRAELSVNCVHPTQKIEVIAADFAQPASVNKLIDHVASLKVDVLVNNAAIQGPIGPLWENDWDEWQRTMQVNLLTPVALCRALISQMLSRREGKIINLSGGGATSPRVNFSAYTVTKAGLVRFSETLAEEVKSAGICVNCIAPGVMNTALLAEVVLAGSEKAGEKEHSQAVKNSASDSTVIRRAAELCTLLASSRGDGITGKLISAVWDPWQQLQEHKETLMCSDIYTLRRIVPKDRGQHWGESE